MNIDSIRTHCKSLPHVTEDVQWGEHLLFRIARKMFCIVALEASAATKLAVKCTPERFAELVERSEVIPAPYMARNYWVALTSWTALRDVEIRELISDSYSLVASKLPKRVQSELNSTKGDGGKTRKVQASRYR